MNKRHQFELSKRTNLKIAPKEDFSETCSYLLSPELMAHSTVKHSRQSYCLFHNDIFRSGHIKVIR